MHWFNPRTIVLRFIVLGILAAFVYPFLPARQQWQVQGSFGSHAADSLLGEYYQPPVEGAQQFALEFQFAIRNDTRQIIGRRDVRYVELGDKLWSRGKQWVVHLRQDAVERLADHLRDHAGAPLYAELEPDWKTRIRIPVARSPIYVDPALFSDDEYFAHQALEDWYPALP